MSIPTLDDITSPQTPDELKAEIIALLANPPEGSGLPAFPATSWQSTSMGPYFVNVEAQVLSQESQVIANVAKGGFRTTAGDPSLVATSGPFVGTSPSADILAREFYDLERAQPISTIGGITMTAAAGVGPVARPAGTVIITTAAGLQYTNVDDVIVPQGSSATGLSFQANAPGSAYNIALSTPLTLVTAIPGVTVSNPGPGAGVTWITQDGTDIESDASLLARCGNQWQALGTGSPSGAYVNWAFAASNEVRRTFVYGAPGTGTVKMRLAGNNSGVSTGAVAAVVAYITPRAPLCVTLDIASATTTSLLMRATIWVPSTSAASAVASANTALAALIPTIPVGGFTFGTGRGVAVSMLTEITENASAAITRVLVEVSNDSGATWVTDFFAMATDEVLVSPGGGNPFNLTTTPA